MKYSSIESFVNYEINLQARERSYAAGCEQIWLCKTILIEEGNKYVFSWQEVQAPYRVRVSTSSQAPEARGRSRGWCCSEVQEHGWKRAWNPAPRRSAPRSPCPSPRLLSYCASTNKQTNKNTPQSIKTSFLTSIHSTFSTQSPTETTPTDAFSTMQGMANCFKVLLSFKRLIRCLLASCSCSLMTKCDVHVGLDWSQAIKDCHVDFFPQEMLTCLIWRLTYTRRI